MINLKQAKALSAAVKDAADKLNKAIETAGLEGFEIALDIGTKEALNGLINPFVVVDGTFIDPAYIGE